MENRNIFDVIEESRLHEKANIASANYRIVGGVALKSYTLAQNINWNDQTVELLPDVYLPSLRRNDTIRDIDTLVVTTDQQEVAEIKDVLTRCIDKNLIVSVFCLKNEVSKKRINFPNMDFVSSHTMSDGRYFMTLDKVNTQLPDDWYDDWLVYKNNSNKPLFKTLSPTVIEANYHMRSITGIRPKDKVKLQNFGEKVYDRKFSEDIVKEYDKYVNQIDIGKTHFNELKKLRDSDSPSWFKLKANLLSNFESNPHLVKAAQGSMDKILSFLVNKK